MVVVILDGLDNLEGDSAIRYVFKDGSHAWVGGVFTRVGIRRVAHRCRRRVLTSFIAVHSVQLLPVWKGALLSSGRRCALCRSGWL